MCLQELKLSLLFLLTLLFAQDMITYQSSITRRVLFKGLKSSMRGIWTRWLHWLVTSTLLHSLGLFLVSFLHCKVGPLLAADNKSNLLSLLHLFARHGFMSAILICFNFFSTIYNSYKIPIEILSGILLSKTQ